VFDGERWERHNSGTGAPLAPTIIGNMFGAIDVGADGDVWIGFDDGAARFDGRRWWRWRSADGLPRGRVHDLAADDHGGAWAATATGIGYFDGAWWRRMPAADAALPGQVNSVAVDVRSAGDTVWFGGEGAVARYDGARWQTYGAAEGVPAASLLDVAVDAQGDAWFSTNVVGVVKCGAARCEIVAGTKGIMDGARGWGIALDAAGRPWVAQGVDGDPARGGLVHFDGQDWVAYSTADGLLDNTVYDVAVDAAGRVWTATLAGVSVFTPPDAPPTPAPTPPTAPTAVPADDAPKVCPQLDGRAPASAITSALADPAALDGWLAPANPNRPVGPFNPRRTWLTLRQPGAAYGPVANGLVWRAGCP